MKEFGRGTRRDIAKEIRRRRFDGASVEEAITGALSAGARGRCDVGSKDGVLSALAALIEEGDDAQRHSKRSESREERIVAAYGAASEACAVAGCDGCALLGDDLDCVLGSPRFLYAQGRRALEGEHAALPAEKQEIKRLQEEICELRLDYDALLNAVELAGISPDALLEAAAKDDFDRSVASMEEDAAYSWRADENAFA